MTYGPSLREDGILVPPLLLKLKVSAVYLVLVCLNMKLILTSYVNKQGQ